MSDDPLLKLLRPKRLTAVVDVGANPIDGDPPYKSLLQKTRMSRDGIRAAGRGAGDAKQAQKRPRNLSTQRHWGRKSSDTADMSSARHDESLQTRHQNARSFLRLPGNGQPSFQKFRFRQPDSTT